MPKLSKDSVQLVEGKIVLYKWDKSPYWYLRFRIGNKWIRTSTKTTELDKAKDLAIDQWRDATFKEKNNLPVISRRFKSVAEAVTQRLQKDRDNGIGPVVNRDYIQAIDNWLIPFFGSHNVASIEYKHIEQFYTYRRDKLGREPARSTVNTHCTALSQVFAEAVQQGYMSEFQVPAVRLEGKNANNGKRGTRRPDFTIDEYKQLYTKLRGWIKKGKKGKPTNMRYLLRDYVLFLGNSGLRHGTETYNLRWNNVEIHTKDNEKIVVLAVTGKTGYRLAVARHSCIRYLKRIAERAEDLQGLTFEEVIKRDEHVFRLPDGTRTKHLDQTFRKCLRDLGLLMDSRTRQNRSLYSLRHFYITQAIMNNKASPALIAKQCGTSILMLEKHYAHLDVVASWQELV